MGFFSGARQAISKVFEPATRPLDAVPGLGQNTKYVAPAYWPILAAEGVASGLDKAESMVGDLFSDLFGGKDGKDKGDLGRIASSFEEIASQQWEMYKKYFAPYEVAVMEGKQEFLPEFKRQTSEGIDVGRRMDEAGAEVMAATRGAEGIRRREISRYGINPDTPTFGNLANQAALQTATGVAGARTAARTQAEGEKYTRLGYYLDKPTPDTVNRALQAYSGAAGSYTALANQVAPPSAAGTILGLVGAGLGGFLGGPAGATVGLGVGQTAGTLVR